MITTLSLHEAAPLTTSHEAASLMASHEAASLMAFHETVPLITLLVFALLVLGVVGSAVPGMPGAPLSIAGVLLYWRDTGYAEPGTLLLVALVGVGVLTWLVDWFAGVFAARAGGASTWTAILAGAVGFALLFVAGPLGVLLGVAGTVFVLEFRRREDARASAKAAAVTTLGILASSLVQVLLTGSMLVAMAWIVLL